MKKKIVILLLVMTILLTSNLAASGKPERKDNVNWVDVHGAGSQRSDPKTGDPEATEYVNGHGPQGDAIRINNMVRPVRSFSKSDLPYSIVDTNQTSRFDNYKSITDTTVFLGQDADYINLEPSYTDNRDGTISDNNTGLMWQQNPEEKMNWNEAFVYLETTNPGEYDDWRIPTIKELYSLIHFSGRDVAPDSTEENTPFINTDYFNFAYGDLDAGERIIDSQYMSSTKYVSSTMDGDETVFGVNFADGRIKGYGMMMRGEQKDFFVILVRGNTEYGINNFVDNGDGTISDLATGLMWMQDDYGTMNWEDALNSCENLNYADYDDWRLPDTKELQSLVDYSRSPETTNSAAIDPLFNTSIIVNEAGDEDYGFYWSSTTHVSSSAKNEGSAAAYVSFGKSLGNMTDMQTPEMGGPGKPPMGAPPKRK
jgi:Protein of unknown function (DUF1566)